MASFDPGGVGFGGNLSSLGASGGITGFGGLGGLGKSFNFMDMLKGIGSGFSGMFKEDGLFQSAGFTNALKGGSLAMETLLGKKALDLGEKQVGILSAQEERARKAQAMNTNFTQSLALQTTQPGTPEHQMVLDAIENGTFQV